MRNDSIPPAQEVGKADGGGPALDQSQEKHQEGQGYASAEIYEAPPNTLADDMLVAVGPVLDVVEYFTGIDIKDLPNMPMPENSVCDLKDLPGPLTWTLFISYELACLALFIAFFVQQYILLRTNTYISLDSTSGECSEVPQVRKNFVPGFSSVISTSFYCATRNRHCRTLLFKNALLLYLSPICTVGCHWYFLS